MAFFRDTARAPNHHEAILFLQDFTKFQEENPNLSKAECIERFSETVATADQPQLFTSSARQNPEQNLPPQNIMMARTEPCPVVIPSLDPESCSSGGMPITRATTTFSKLISLPQGTSQSTSINQPLDSIPNLTSPLVPSSSTFLDLDPSSMGTMPSHPQGLQKALGGVNRPALTGWLDQTNQTDAFPLLRHAVDGLGDDELPFNFQMDHFQTDHSQPPFYSLPNDEEFVPTNLDLWTAPRMEHQYSNTTTTTTTEYFTGDDGYLDSPISLSSLPGYPMSRGQSRIRSYSQGSFGNTSFSIGQGYNNSSTFAALSSSPPTMANGLAMTRQPSAANFPNNIAMSRMRSTSGGELSDAFSTNFEISSKLPDVEIEKAMEGEKKGEGIYHQDCRAKGNTKSMLRGPRDFVVAEEHGDSLKRGPSMSTEDLRDSEMGEAAWSQKGSPKSSKQKRRIIRRRVEEPTVVEEILSTSPARRVGKPVTRLSSHLPKKSTPRQLPIIKSHNKKVTVGRTSGRLSYSRPPHPRVHCDQCTAHPEGFRGDHELRRHTDRVHAVTRKMYVIKDISKDQTLLAKCKACQARKMYGVDYNAAAHLRRQHFNPVKKNDKSSPASNDSTQPDMAYLRSWIEEIEVKVDGSMKKKFDKNDNNVHVGANKEEEALDRSAAEDTEEQEEENEEEQKSEERNYCYKTEGSLSRHQNALDLMSIGSEKTDSALLTFAASDSMIYDFLPLSPTYTTNPNRTHPLNYSDKASSPNTHQLISHHEIGVHVSGTAEPHSRNIPESVIDILQHHQAFSQQSEEDRPCEPKFNQQGEIVFVESMKNRETMMEPIDFMMDQSFPGSEMSSNVGSERSLIGTW